MANKTAIIINIQNVVQGSEAVKGAALDLDKVCESAQRLQAQMNKKSLFGDAIIQAAAFSVAMMGLNSSLTELSASLLSFDQAMRATNTMAGKSGADYERMKDKVSELAKTIPLAREELANGLYQVISNGVPEDNWMSYLEGGEIGQNYSSCKINPICRTVTNLWLVG